MVGKHDSCTTAAEAGVGGSKSSFMAGGSRVTTGSDQNLEDKQSAESRLDSLAKYFFIIAIVLLRSE